MSFFADPSKKAKPFPGLAGLKIAATAKVIAEAPIEFLGPLGLQGSGTIRLGGFSYFRNGILRGPLSIGRFCSCGPDVLIGEANHPTDWLSSSPFQ